MSAPEYCANCGAPIPPNARACPKCGADERTGWAEQDVYDGIDLPDDAETLERNSRSRQKREGHRWFWAYVAIVLVLLLVIASFGLR